MLENVTRWSNSGSRLVKARSSPNVWKMPLSTPRKQDPSEQNGSPTVKSVRNAKVPAATKKPAKPSNDNSNGRASVSAGHAKTPRSSSLGKPHAEPAKQPSTVKKQLSKATSSPSCVILDDRTLLKKRLSYTPAKPPKKPEALRKKVGLDHSASLGYVSLGSESSRTNASLSAEAKKETKRDFPRRKPMNRSASLWSIQTLSRNENSVKENLASSRPSKIPLLAQRNARVGRSLADLSQVDRALEPTARTVPLGNVDLDLSAEERIYENCIEAFDSVSTDAHRKTARLSSSNFEERVARLMAQLDDEDDDGDGDGDEDDEEEPGTVSNDCVDAAARNGKLGSSKTQDTLRGNLDSVQAEIKAPIDVKDSRKKREGSNQIQELKKNWERPETLRDSKKNSESEERLRIDQQREEDVRQTSKSKHSAGKVAKEIENLVNFFNCKNAKVANENKDHWTRSQSTDETVANLKKSMDIKSINGYNGYVSDGNCSEDSGHMSNENEAEWKESVQNEAKRLDKEDGFFERNKLGVNDVFRSVIVDRLEPEKETVTVTSSVSASSGASSIDSCKGENAKLVAIAPYNNERQIFFRSGTLERFEAQRDEKLTGHIILLQARCRGYLARRKLNTLKLQDLAVRCIQRNIRKWISVREWAWWRLYIKVAPLLNVHRTEDQLKAKTEELEILRAKVERLEQERNHLKRDNDILEAKLSEISADFAEEHSTSTLAAERINAETSERLRLERELQDVTVAHKNLQQATERLEMELLYARAADLNGVASDVEEGEDGGVYKQRYEHAVRELEFTKRKMTQQHEDDLEQLVGLKKQLEKKLADAYEEVEEQRQVVGQWKRRVQKLNGEMHDLRLLLEEQTTRNNLLEKKQRKFDSETQNLLNDLRQEKAQRERVAREKEIAIAEKFTIEQNLSDARLEIELKEERLRTLSQELEELTFGGKTEEEVAHLKKAKHELEKRVKDQEEELDDLAGQVQLLEQAKLRLEMSIEQQRKEMRKEMQLRDEELEDVRGSALKKVKALESQLENEHEERTILLREKHELERRLVTIEEQDRAERAIEAETMHRLKRDLKRTKALLRDAQTMLERSKGESTGKAALRQLKNQLEDAECARAVAIKAKQALELELNEIQASLDEALRQRSEVEERASIANRERTELLSQLEENEEELAEVLKKYRAAVQQVSAEQGQLQEAQIQITALETEKSSLKDQLLELTQRLESVEQLGDPTANSLVTRRLEFRTKELESKLELEQTTRARLETQIARLKENVEKLQIESTLLRTKEQTAQDAARRLQKSLREAREEVNTAVTREQEATRAHRELEKSLEAAEAETKIARDDLRLALQRIDDLQSAIQGELDLDCSEEATTENSDSD